MKKKMVIAFIIIIALVLSIVFFRKNETKEEIKNDYIEEAKNTTNNIIKEDIGESELDIELIDVDNSKTNFIFEYNDEEFKAIYTDDNWKVIDSFKIRRKKDIVKICQCLIDIHPIHGNDMTSYRTSEDMAYEWIQHNIAYDILPDDNAWKMNAKDVDLDPFDQGKNLKEMYEQRTGEKFDIKKIIENNK